MKLFDKGYLRVNIHVSVHLDNTKKWMNKDSVE